MNISKISNSLKELEFKTKDIDKGLIFTNDQGIANGFVLINSPDMVVPLPKFLNAIENSPNYCCSKFFIITNGRLNLSHINALSSKSNFIFIDKAKNEFSLVEEIISYLS